MKKLLLFIGCLVALYPWTAWASPDPPLVSSTLVFSLVLVFLFAVGFGWLFQQLRKMTLLHRETLTQLQALRQMGGCGPLAHAAD